MNQNENELPNSAQESPQHESLPPVPIVPPAPAEPLVEIQAPGTSKNSSTIPTPAPVMEVHHHGHVHEEKKWKEYVFQFFMLFLAVFCGFLAENIREQIVERHREKEYIESFIQDLKQDTVHLRRAINAIATSDKGIDSLLTVARDSNLATPRNTKWFYYYYFSYVPSMKRFYVHDGTMQQLKNAGGLRLIRNAPAVDSILFYDVFNQGIEKQGESYERHVIAGIDAGDYIFDWARPEQTRGSQGAAVFLLNDSLTVLKPDKERLQLFLNKIAKQKATAGFYKAQLEEQLQYAARLIPFLRKQYHLNEDEN